MSERFLKDESQNDIPKVIFFLYVSDWIWVSFPNKTTENVITHISCKQSSDDSQNSDSVLREKNNLVKS